MRLSICKTVFHFSLVAQSCPTPCDPMDCSMPGFLVYHQLLELAQTHVHRVGDAIQPSRLRWSLLLPPSIFPSIRVFSNELILHTRHPKYWSFNWCKKKKTKQLQPQTDNSIYSASYVSVSQVLPHSFPLSSLFPSLLLSAYLSTHVNFLKQFNKIFFLWKLKHTHTHILSVNSMICIFSASLIQKLHTTTIFVSM